MALPATRSPDRQVSARAKWATEIAREAHQRTVDASAAEMATHLQDVFGQKLTAVITGVEDPKTVGKWMRGQQPHETHRRRLRDAFHVATLLSLGASSQTARSWFMGMNPLLEDQAPALVIADDPRGGTRVMHAALAFLANG